MNEENARAIIAKPVMSRRAFFSLGAVVGSLHFLGSVTSGNALVKAFADDEGNVSFVIEILNKEEIGVFVVDASNGNKPVAGAHVKVKSGYNGQIVEGDTGIDGMAKFNVKNLAANQDALYPDNYWFFAEAEVTKSGYREFAFFDQIVFSGPQKSGQAHILLPTQAFDAASDFYLRAACFDGADLLYHQFDIPKYASNDADHTFTFQIGCKEGKTATCTVVADGVAAGGPVSAVAGSNNYATIEITDKYIQKYPVQTKFSVVFEVGGIQKSCDLLLAIREPNNDVCEPFFSDEWCISVGSGAGKALVNGTFSGDIPDEYATAQSNDANAGTQSTFKSTSIDLPVLPWGKLTTLIDLPWSPISFATTPDGGIGFSFNSDTYSVFGKKGPDPDPKESFKESWKRRSEQGTQSWYDAIGDSIDKGVELFEKSNQNKNPKTGLGASGFASFDITYQYTFGALAYILDKITDVEREQREKKIKQGIEVPPHQYRWGATVRGCFNLLIAGEVGAQCQVGPIPVVVGLDYYLMTSPSVEAGVEFIPPFRDPKWFLWTQGVHGQGGFNIDITGEMGLSAGIGVKGIASVGVRGYVTFPLLFGFVKAPDKAFPHIKADGRAGVQATAQVLFIKVRADIVKPAEWHMYDNWKSSNELMANGQPLNAQNFYQDYALGAPLADDVDYEMTYTPDDVLEETAELTAEINNSGLVCSYTTCNVALPDADELIAAKQGFVDPFGTEQNASYDPRKGLIPKIQEPFTVKQDMQSNDQTNAFSDSRIRIVQAGDRLFFCRIATVQIESATANVTCKAVPMSMCDAGVTNDTPATCDAEKEDFFFVPSTQSALPNIEYKAPTETDPACIVVEEYASNTNLYADENGMGVPQANIAVPVISEIGGTYLEELDNTNENITERVQALAFALGVDPGTDIPEEGLLYEASQIMEGAAQLSDCANSVKQAAARTRVIITPLNLKTRTWGKTDVLDFALKSSAPQTMRCNTNDVDFSVSVYKDEQTGEESLIFGVVSCTKPLRKTRTLQFMKEGLYTSVMVYTPNPTGHGEVSNVNCNIFQEIGENHYEWKAEPFVMKRQGANDNEPKAYIGLASTGARGTYDLKPHNAFITHFYPMNSLGAAANSESNGDVNVLILHPDSLDSGERIHALNDDGILHAFVQKRAGGSDALILSWQYVQSTTENSPVDTSKQLASLWSVDTDGTGSVLGGAPCDFVGAENYTVLGADKGIVWTKRNERNTETKLMNVKMDTATGMPVAGVSDLGNLDTNGFFTSGNADYLYGVRIKEGSTVAPDNDTASSLRDCVENGGTVYTNESGFVSSGVDMNTLAEDGADTDVKSYQLVACRWDPKYHRYREFFPYAQLNSAPDDINAYALPTMVSNGGDDLAGGTALVYSTITDIASQKASLTYVEVPPALVLKFESVECFDNFIEKGGTVHPTIRVSNAGNLPISAFTVRFEDEQGTTIGTYRVKDLHKQVINPLRPIREEEAEQYVPGFSLQIASPVRRLGSLSSIPERDGDETTGEYSEEDEAILWPGSVRNYKTELTTPQSWSDKHTIKVFLDNIETPAFANGSDDILFDNEDIFFTAMDPAEHDIDIELVTEQKIKAQVKPVTYREGSDLTPKTGDGMGGVLAAAGIAAAAGAVAVTANVAKDKQEQAQE